MMAEVLASEFGISNTKEFDEFVASVKTVKGDVEAGMANQDKTAIAEFFAQRYDVHDLAGAEAFATQYDNIVN